MPGKATMIVHKPVEIIHHSEESIKALMDITREIIAAPVHRVL
jgi:hypothetical protein